MRLENEIKINIFRHGKTLLNERHCYVGVTDEGLSKNGETEVLEKKEKYDYKNPDTVFISPMKRCINTAEILFPNAEKIVIDELREMDFGSFEGKCYEELKDNIHYRKWIDQSRGMSPKEIEEIYGNRLIQDERIILPESKEDFSNRVINGIKIIINKSIANNSVTIVAHGGTIMALAGMDKESDYYKYMVGCAEGIEARVLYTVDENGSIEISRVSVVNRICS